MTHYCVQREPLGPYLIGLCYPLLIQFYANLYTIYTLYWLSHPTLLKTTELPLLRYGFQISRRSGATVMCDCQSPPPSNIKMHGISNSEAVWLYVSTNTLHRLFKSPSLLNDQLIYYNNVCWGRQILSHGKYLF